MGIEMNLVFKKEQWDKLVIGLSFILIVVMLLNFSGEYYGNKVEDLEESFETVRSLDLNNWIGLNTDLTNYYIVALEYDLKPTPENYDRMIELKEIYENSKEESLEHLINPTIYGKEEYFQYSKYQRRIENSKHLYNIKFVSTSD